jgi:SAM-dependent methyltransferase
MADLDLPDWEATWPQRRERHPSFVDPYYLHYSALVASLAAARDRYVTPPARILDIGCGDMPYYPLFARVSEEYVGTDIEPGPNVTHVCPVEALEIDDAMFDVVLCTQVLEHSRNPAQALREIARVLKPGGHAFATTHGIWPFHPYPVDLWRWTQQGLELLVADTPGLTLEELVPHRGTASALALMVNYYVDVVTRRRVLAPIRWATISALNVAGLAGDRVRRLAYPNQDTLIHNFLVVCSRDRAPS